MQRRKRKKGPKPRKQAPRVEADVAVEEPPLSLTIEPPIKPRLQPRPKPPRRPLPPAAIAVALFLVCLACYLANGRTSPTAKTACTLPNRILPFCVLAFHTITLDPFATELAPDPQKWRVQRRHQHLVSFYPLGPTLIALPIFRPAAAV